MVVVAVDGCKVDLELARKEAAAAAAAVEDLSDSKHSAEQLRMVV